MERLNQALTEISEQQRSFARVKRALLAEKTQEVHFAYPHLCLLCPSRAARERLFAHADLLIFYGLIFKTPGPRSIPKSLAGGALSHNAVLVQHTASSLDFRREPFPRNRVTSVWSVGIVGTRLQRRRPRFDASWKRLGHWQPPWKTAPRLSRNRHVMFYDYLVVCNNFTQI